MIVNKNDDGDGDGDYDYRIDKESTFSTFSVYAPATLVKSGADHYIGVA